MVPTKERNQIGVFVRTASEGILIDCGEGMQRQFKIAGASITDITKILISHWHGDHTLGLPGLIQSMSASDYGRTLEIYGPKETKKRIENMFEVFVFDSNLNWFAKLWLFERRIFYNNYLFFTDATLVESNKDKENIGQFYFIKTGPGAHLDNSRYLRNTSTVIEDEFLARDIKPVKEIYRLDGQLAFKIYHYLPGTFAD